MNLITQMERWHRDWRTLTDAADAERQLRRLRWLEDFAFRSGPEIRVEEFRALQQLIEMGEKKLAELSADGGAKPPVDNAVPESRDSSTSAYVPLAPCLDPQATYFATAGKGADAS
jgi:hypothetical protein